MNRTLATSLLSLILCANAWGSSFEDENDLIHQMNLMASKAMRYTEEKIREEEIRSQKSLDVLMGRVERLEEKVDTLDNRVTEGFVVVLDKWNDVHSQIAFLREENADLKELIFSRPEKHDVAIQMGHSGGGWTEEYAEIQQGMLARHVIPDGQKFLDLFNKAVNICRKIYSEQTYKEIQKNFDAFEKNQDFVDYKDGKKKMSLAEACEIVDLYSLKINEYEKKLTSMILKRFSRSQDDEPPYKFQSEQGVLTDFRAKIAYFDKYAKKNIRGASYIFIMVQQLETDVRGMIKENRLAEQKHSKEKYDKLISILADR